MRIVFTGDIAFSQCFYNGWREGGCLEQSIKDYLAEADHVIANVESPMTVQNIELDKKLVHCCDPAAAEYLTGNNIRIWNLANNHMKDCGDQGMLDTLKHASEHHCRTVGAGCNLEDAAEPLLLEEKVRVGVLAIARDWPHIPADESKPGVFTWDQTEKIKNRLRDLREQVDWVVIVVHAGDEFCSIPMPYVRERYKTLLSWGADIIVAHHPHVVQNYERFEEKIVFYSLGNFIFDTDHQREFAHTDVGVLVAINFTKQNYTIDAIGTHVDRIHQTVEQHPLPSVFQEINAKEYKKLWPLEAKHFYPVDFRKRMKLNKRYQTKSWIWRKIREVYLCKNIRERTIHIGRVLCSFGAWKRSTLKDVVNYLNEQKSQ